MKSGERSGTIVVAGAGIAGLSAAIALKLAGFPVEVVERETKLDTIGAGIQLGPNATRIMEAWNLALLGASVEPQGIELRNARTGALLNTIPLARAVRARYGAPYITLLRKDLQTAMLSRAGELGIPIKFGCPLTAVQTRGQVLAVEAGGESLSAAALVGADGLNSMVRRTMASSVRRFSHHATAWRAILPLGALAAPFRNTIIIWMSPAAHLVHYPVSGGTCLNAVLAIEDGHQPEDGAGDDAAMRLVFGRVRSWADVPRLAIASTNQWQPWQLYGIEKWAGGEGRVQTVGDAWHAMLPYLASGAVMAIEDAAALAASLTETGEKPELGLKLFREKRGPRVWRAAKRSAQMGRIYHCPQPFGVVRDLAIKAATGPMLLARNDWLYRAPSPSRPSKVN
jgi:salicylate hydroxylase